MKIATTNGKYLYSQDLEIIKTAKRMDGGFKIESVDSIKSFVLNTFECALKLFAGQAVDITYCSNGKVFLTEYHESLEYVKSDEEYVFNNNIKIENWKIEDILFDMGVFENVITILMIDGDKVIISFGELDA